ncbi:unnamed protein product [Rhizoctonia solani]|uniref:Uncharacterized protein n=2 Tax=Rhizoctonia solani TaxID=456999 RepID=A0A8H7LKQ0_9AGAM|nr:uncharacterized protein RhiXN_00763 [Rhizoctonia solani]KAF8680204.1 hypothetical protein RHS04_04242 [Rhizoctonia solani]QRW19357.1 hypothetical protein RhiXN_00763 [Rhizoctonia solani]CAE6494494.1 unnamed protein product [Rhizoctonia solani]
MAAFTSLPGELTVIIRQCIPCDDLSTHLALHVVARGARLTLYDEAVWRDLCYANGFGGIFSRDVIEGWRKSALVLSRYQELMGESHYRRYGPLQWSRSLPLASIHPPSSHPSLELHPAFSSLSFDRRALAASQGLSAAYLHAQPWDLDDQKSRTIADQIADVTPTQLERHIGAYALATVPAVSELNVLFDHWGASLDANTAKDACSFTSELARVQRDDGVRVIDVVGGILKWLMTPLTDTQVDKLVELDRMLDPELYAMLEFSTDPDTLSAYWKRKYQRRGDVFKAHFAGLRPVEGEPNTVRAVWCPEIRFEVLGYNGVVNAKEIGDTPAAGSWLAAQINRIATLA